MLGDGDGTGDLPAGSDGVHLHTGTVAARGVRQKPALQVLCPLGRMRKKIVAALLCCCCALNFQQRNNKTNIYENVVFGRLNSGPS